MLSRLRDLSRFELLVWTLALLALGVTAYTMGALVVAEQIFNGVCGIFWAIGRAILNGFTLYEDIFETKPPPIFLLSAVSEAVFGNQSLGYVLHTVLLFAVPAGLVVYARRRLAEQGSRSLMLVLFALLLGTVVVRYLSRHPTAWAIEFYGLGFACLYVLLLADARTFGWRRILVLTFAFGGAVGMKESFLLPMLAGALLVMQSREAVLRGVLLPAVLSGLIGIVTLAILGSLHAYVTAYLPEMFGYYVQRFYIPFVLKGLALDKVGQNLAQFSGSFLLLTLAAAALPLRSGGSRGDVFCTWFFRLAAALWIVALPSTSFVFFTSQAVLALAFACAAHRVFVRRTPLRAAWYCVTVAASVLVASWYSCSGILFVQRVLSGVSESSLCVAPSVLAAIMVCMGIPVAFAIFCVLRIPKDSGERPLLLSIAALLASSFLFYSVIILQVSLPFVWTTVAFVLALGAFARAWWTRRGTDEGDVLRLLGIRFGAVFLAVYSVSMGSDFQGHHFLSVAPLVLAFFLPSLDLLARGTASGSNRSVSLWLLGIAVVVLLNPLRHPSLDDLPSALAASRTQVEEYQEQARQIDAILDACELRTYFVIGAGDVYAFTRHSPGNYFLWAGLEAIGHHPQVSERTLISVADADIVLIGPGLDMDKLSEEEAGTLRYFGERFTETPWDCAQGIDPPKGLAVLYRTDRTANDMPDAR